MTTARSLNIGFRLTASATITVTLPSADAQASGCLFRGSDETCHGLSLINNNTQLQITAGAGDHVITVDTTDRPSGTAPCTVSFGTSVLLWSTQHPDLGATTRPWETGTGNLVSVTDPKDPWPMLTSPSAGVSAFGTTSISNTMNDLRIANSGRAGVEEPDDATAAAS